MSNNGKENKNKYPSTLERRTKAFAEEYVSNGYNGTEAYLKVYPRVKDRSVANVNSSRKLSKASTQSVLTEVMEERGITKDFISDTLKRNIKQSENYSASNQAVDIYAKLTGEYAPEKRQTLSVSLKGEDLDKAIKTLTEELNSL